MTIEKRLTDLERAITPASEAPIRIRVFRVLADIPEEDWDRWCQAHPEAVSKTVDVPAR